MSEKSIIIFSAENLGFDSIEDYVRKYNLFNRAMKLRTLSRDMRVELASAWAEILEETGHQARFSIHVKYRYTLVCLNFGLSFVGQFS